MATAETLRLGLLFERDETAWLEVNSELIRRGRLDEVDLPNLAEYLADMARRDRREVGSRLALLIALVLKWRYRAERRPENWRAPLEVQRQELADLLESETLRDHALHVLERAYERGRRQAVVETDLPVTTFPARCLDSLESLLTGELGDSP